MPSYYGKKNNVVIGILGATILRKHANNLHTTFNLTHCGLVTPCVWRHMASLGTFLVRCRFMFVTFLLLNIVDQVRITKYFLNLYILIDIDIIWLISYKI